jgi:hypothetical protein
MFKKGPKARHCKKKAAGATFYSILLFDPIDFARPHAKRSLARIPSAFSGAWKFGLFGNFWILSIPDH